MEGPVGSRDNVLKSIHHLEGARGLSADDIANHINTTFLAPMEDFEPRTHNPFREDVSVCSSRTVNDVSPLTVWILMSTKQNSDSVEMT